MHNKYIHTLTLMEITFTYRHFQFRQYWFPPKHSNHPYIYPTIRAHENRRAHTKQALSHAQTTRAHELVHPTLILQGEEILADTKMTRASELTA